MISISLIERSLESRDHDRLLRELAANGLILPLSLRMQLGRSPAAVKGLALRRVIELTYGPTPLSRDLTAALTASLAPAEGRGRHDAAESGFELNAKSVQPDDEAGDPLILAAVLAGLAAAAEDQPAAADERVTQTVTHGYATLACLQDADGLFTTANDRSLADRALTTAFIVGLLGSRPGFTRRLRLHELFTWFDRRDGQLDRHTQQLWDLAGIALSGAGAGSGLLYQAPGPMESGADRAPVLAA